MDSLAREGWETGRYKDTGITKDNPAPADGNTNALPDIDFPAAALYLAETYANLLVERNNIRQWLDGHKVFTVDMAIEELMSLTTQSEGERVQTSGLSDQTSRIAEKLAGGYVKKRQRQMEREAVLWSRELSYAEWKIGVVDEAMEKRMTRNDAAFFRLMFVRKKTFREIREAHRGNRIYNHDISRRKKSVLKAVEDELRFRACWKTQEENMRLLSGELSREAAEKERL